MKKIYSLMIALLLGAGAFAQVPAGQTIDLTKSNIIHSLSSIPTISAKPHNSAASASSGGTKIWLEYDSADANYNGENNAHALAFPMNKRFTTAADVKYNLFKSCVVSFDSLFDLYTGPGLNSGITRDTVANMTVDSIYAVIGHQNVSGLNDTLIVRIINLNASRYPGTTTLWADTFITNTSMSPNGLWNSGSSPVKLKFDPNFTFAMKGFAVQLDYYAPLSDTLSFVAGFQNLGACGVCPSRANISNFYPNTYAAWNAQPSYPLIPTPNPNSLDIVVPCDQAHPNDPPPACNGYNYLQDIIIGAWVTINPSTVGINEELKNTGIGLYQNVPNPLHNYTDIQYELANNAKNVSLTVCDVVGNKVMEVKEGNKAPGKYTIPLDATKLAKGMYTYTLNADGSQLTKRMIIE